MMIHVEGNSQTSVSSDDDFQLHSEQDTFKSHTNRSMMHRALRYFQIVNPSTKTKPFESHQQDDGRQYNSGRKAPSRVRIKSRLCLVMAMLYSNHNKALAFQLEGSSKRQFRYHITSIEKKNSWKKCRHPFTVGMNENDDSTFENLDDPEDMDDNEKGELASSNKDDLQKLKSDYKKRITRLEDIVSRQEVEIHRLKNTCAELGEVSQAFGQLLNLLREAGLAVETFDSPEEEKAGDEASTTTKNQLESGLSKVIESYDDALIFGTAPSSVIDAADGAGAAILAAMLGGKQRMLVDVRDAELSNDPETLVQFIELAILPIAAGLEGLKSQRNRVKIVFPKVSQLLEYRRTMALAAPEVVALSTLGFDPVEKRDKLVVIVAPEPDDEEGIQAIRDLLIPTEEGVQPIQQPVVILNYHMLPFSGIDLKFETAYHLRLLAVQYMADLNTEELIEQAKEENNQQIEKLDDDDDEIKADIKGEDSNIDNDQVCDAEEPDSDDEALESAMKHAHEVGVNEGVTRAMVIRAYPRPWHIFVDLSPNTNADFEVAATFDKEPTMDELNYAIVECLEGSEREDEIVAQQMQQALEDGQLKQVSDILSGALDQYFEEDDDDDASLEDEEDDDFDMFEEDSV
mmetsp:Transcript_12471/g.31403  ORF Transcript_12471/g.31403 Transcript_12471/m.31403 type:complete len:630 (+) Transcript_12471:196-2085(+)